MVDPIGLFVGGAVVVLAMANPFLLAPIFMRLTQGWETSQRNAVATRAVMVAAGIMIGCILIGQLVLNLFGITIPALQVAGGLIFIQIGFQMLGDDSSKNNSEDVQPVKVDTGIAIVPMAIPMMAGPGMIAILISIAAQLTGLGDLVGLIGGLLVGLFIVLLMLRAAPTLMRVLGDAGTQILTKLMGLIVLSVGISLGVAGLLELLPGLAG